MARANLKSTISLDATAFSAGVRKVKLSAANTARAVGASFKKIGGTIATLSRSMAKFATIAAGITFAAAIAGAYKLGTALKRAFDTGGALSDLSAQTGIAVRELAILQQAFEDNGVSGEQVGAVVNKMQRSISDLGAGLSTQVRAFERLGLSYDILATKSPLEQFEAVQRAIAGIENPTTRAATAMEIFGRSGGQMLTLFQDGGAIQKASETLGTQADLLDKNANTFDRISDLLNSAGTKIQGFIVGVADVAAPKILEALEKFNAIDFASIGNRFAKGFSLDTLSTIGSFLASVLSDAITTAMEIGYSFFRSLFSPEGLSFLGDAIIGAFKAAGQGLADTIVAVLEWASNQLVDTTQPGFMEGTDTTQQEDDTGAAASFIEKMKEQMGMIELGPSDKTKELFDKLSESLLKNEKATSDATEAAKYEKERQEQKEFVAEAEAQEKAKNRSSISAADIGMSGVHVSPHVAALKNPALMGAFDKLQADKANGIGVGTTGVFASDRERLGIASGLSSGGLGAVKKVGQKQEASRAKKEDTLSATNSHLTEQNKLLKENNTLLQEGLAG